MERRRNRWNHPGRHLFSGFVFLTIGLVFLLGNMGFIDVNYVVRFWPVILIALGVMKMVESHDEFRSGSGVFFIVLGLLFLMGNFNILRIAFHDLWPLVLIGLGCLMLWRSTVVRREREENYDTKSNLRDDSTGTDRRDDTNMSSNSILSATAILGGVERRNNCQDFRGGDATAILGGCQIDLRSASITANHEPVLEVFAMWGGIEIRVPDDWTVISKVDPILGGYEDKTRPPRDESKRFVIRGSVVMGGIEVRN